jgi:hypothetical protein
MGIIISFFNFRDIRMQELFLKALPSEVSYK